MSTFTWLVRGRIRHELRHPDSWRQWTLQSVGDSIPSWREGWREGGRREDGDPNFDMAEPRAKGIPSSRPLALSSWQLPDDGEPRPPPPPPAAPAPRPPGSRRRPSGRPLCPSGSRLRTPGSGRAIRLRERPCVHFGGVRGLHAPLSLTCFRHAGQTWPLRSRLRTRWTPPSPLHH